MCQFVLQVRVVSEEALAAIKGMSESQLESSCSRLREPIDLVEKIKSTYEEAKKLVQELHEMKEEMLGFARENPVELSEQLRFASENPVELSAQKCQLKTKLPASICVSNDLLLRVLRSIPVGGKVVFLPCLGSACRFDVRNPLHRKRITERRSLSRRQILIFPTHWPHLIFMLKRSSLRAHRHT